MGVTTQASKRKNRRIQGVCAIGRAFYLWRIKSEKKQILLVNFAIIMAKQSKQKTDYLKAYAKRLYVNDGMSVELISQTIDRATRTIQAWKKNENWDELRANYLGRNDILKDEAAKNIKAIFDVANKENRPLNAGELDGVAKLNKLIANLSNELTLSHYTQIMMDFTSYLMDTQGVDVAKQIIDYQGDFINYIKAKK